MEEYFTHTLPNGLRLLHLPIETPVSSSGYAVTAGTRAEGATARRLAPSVAHMLPQ